MHVHTYLDAALDFHSTRGWCDYTALPLLNYEIAIVLNVMCMIHITDFKALQLHIKRSGTSSSLIPGATLHTELNIVITGIFIDV